MQNDLKILPSKSSLLNSPVIFANATCALRSSSASNSPAIHFHLLVLDGVYVRVKDRLEFRRVAPPTKAELDQLLQPPLLPLAGGRRLP